MNRDALIANIKSNASAANDNPVTPDTIKGLVAARFVTNGKAYKAQCTWNNKMARLLAREPKKFTSFLPKEG